MTPDELLALPVTVDLLTAAKAFGISRSLAYDLAGADRFPCRVQRLGIRYRVVTQGPGGLLAACGIGLPGEARGEAANR